MLLSTIEKNEQHFEPIYEDVIITADERLHFDTDYKVRNLGTVAIGVELEANPESNDSLLSAIRRAKEGDEQAKAMVAINVGSDFSERVIKAGEVTKYHLQKNEEGKFVQHGQLYSDIYANTLRLTDKNSKMRLRAEAEARNAKRIEYLEQKGILKDNYMIVFSLAPEDMTDEELEKVGFFTETKTMSIQATTAEDDDLSIESAFVAGVPKLGTKRSDLQTIIKLGLAFGVDYKGMTTTEILDTPLIIPKSQIKNGVIDLVELFDECNGGTFFGEAKSRLNYLDFRKFCDERRKSFADDTKIVSEQLINEADNLTSQVQATEKLAKLSETQMVKRAIKDKTINERVFGDVSAKFIEQAREYEVQGYFELALRAEKQAIRTADSGSCPSGIGRQSDIDDITINVNKSSENQKDCEFVSKMCPVCKEKNAKTIVKKGVYYHVGKSCKA